LPYTTSYNSAGNIYLEGYIKIEKIKMEMEMNIRNFEKFLQINPNCKVVEPPYKILSH